MLDWVKLTVFTVAFFFPSHFCLSCFQFLTEYCFCCALYLHSWLRGWQRCLGQSWPGSSSTSSCQAPRWLSTATKAVSSRYPLWRSIVLCAFLGVLDPDCHFVIMLWYSPSLDGLFCFLFFENSVCWGGGVRCVWIYSQFVNNTLYTDFSVLPVILLIICNTCRHIHAWHL